MEYIGYSKGKKYRVIKVDPDNPCIGLCVFPESQFAQWCTFEKIEQNEKQ
jgi:hypothetical protein